MADNKKIEIDVLIKEAEAAKSIRDLRKVMKELAMAQEEVDKTSPDFANLVDAINTVEGRIGDLNDSMKTFAGSGMERLTSSTGLLREGIQNLDFEKISISLQGLKQLPKALAGEFDKLTGSVKKLDFKNLGSAMKSLANSGVGTLTKSILQLGRAILTNPILLLASVIIGLIALFVRFYDKIVPIRIAVEAMGAAFDYLIKLVTDFSDAIGLTNIAEEKALNKTIEKYAAANEAVSQRYDNEIKLAQAAGNKTFDLERKKTLAVMNGTDQQIKALQRLRVINGKLTDEQKKQLKDLRKEYIDLETDVKVIELKKQADIAETKKKEDEKAKAAADKAKAEAEKKKQQFLQDTEALSKMRDAYDDIINVKDEFEKKRSDAHRKLVADMAVIEKSSASDADKEKTRQIARRGYEKELTNIKIDEIVKRKEITSKYAQEDVATAELVRKTFADTEQNYRDEINKTSNLQNNSYINRLNWLTQEGDKMSITAKRIAAGFFEVEGQMTEAIKGTIEKPMLDIEKVTKKIIKSTYDPSFFQAQADKVLVSIKDFEDKKMKLATTTYTSEQDKLKQSLKDKKITQQEYDVESVLLSIEYLKQQDTIKKESVDAQKKLNEQVREDNKLLIQNEIELLKLSKEDRIKVESEAAQREIDIVKNSIDDQFIAKTKNWKSEMDALDDKQRKQGLIDVEELQRYKELEMNMATAKEEADKRKLVAENVLQAEISSIQERASMDGRKLTQEDIDYYKNLYEEQVKLELTMTETDEAGKAAIRDKWDKLREENMKNFQVGRTLRAALELKLLDDEKAKEIEAAEGNQAKIYEIETKYAALRKKTEEDLNEEKKASNQAYIQTVMTTTANLTESLKTLSDTYYNNQLQNAGNDLKARNKILEKQFKTNKAFSMADAIMKGAQAVQAALTLPPPAGEILAGINAGLAAANIAQIASQKFVPEQDSGSSSAGIGSSLSAGAITSTTMKTPQFFTLGTNKAGNPIQKVVVVESDITKVQQNVSNIQAKATQRLGA